MVTIMYRCKCKRFFSLKRKSCPACQRTLKDAKYYISHNIGGKFTAVVGGDTLAETKEKAARILMESPGGRNEYKKGKIYLSDFVKEVYLPEHLRNEYIYADAKTIRGKENMVLYPVSKLPDKLIRDITPDDIDDYLQSIINEGHKPSTFNRRLASLKALFNFAVKKGYLKKSPMETKTLRTFDRERYLTEDEKERVLQVCKESRSKFLYNMVLVAMYTGMRLGEIRRLKREHVRDGFINIPARNTKTKKVKHVPIAAELQKLFDSIKGEFDFNHNPYTIFQKACDKAGVEDFSYHDLRHTFASTLITNRVELLPVSKLLGHKNIQTTLKYAHVNDDTLRAAVKTLEAKPIKPEKVKISEEQHIEAEKKGLKYCPECAEMVKLAAKICRFCRYQF